MKVSVNEAGDILVNGVPCPSAFPTIVYHKETGEEILYCVSADDETGEWVARKPGPDGMPYWDPATDDVVNHSGKCPLRIVLPEGCVIPDAVVTSNHS